MVASATMALPALPSRRAYSSAAAFAAAEAADLSTAGTIVRTSTDGNALSNSVRTTLFMSQTSSAGAPFADSAGTGAGSAEPCEYCPETSGKTPQYFRASESTSFGKAMLTGISVTFPLPIGIGSIVSVRTVPRIGASPLSKTT